MKKAGKLGLLGLTMISIAAITSLRSLPMMSGYGLTSIAYFMAVAVIFFIPAALISAELATAWPQKGGVYVWVSKAWGDRVGFLAIWLQWIQSVIWYPIVLSFAASSLAYAIDPSLAKSKLFTLLVILSAYWIGTFANFFGMKYAGFVSSIALLIGTVLPAILIIIFGGWWLFQGGSSEIPITKAALIPHPDGISSLVVVAGVLITFVGIEMSASHAKDTQYPEINYPRAIFIATGVILALYTLGTIVVGVILPSSELNMVSGLIEAFTIYLKDYDLAFFLPLIACAIALGVFGQVSSWISGPSKGLLNAAQKGYLPKVLREVNDHGVQVHILFLQGGIVSILSLIFIFIPSIDTAYWILSMLCANLYLTMYVLMFTAAIRLRYTHPNVKRSYSVPGGNLGMWIAGSMGAIGAVCTIAISYIPPSQFPDLSADFYRGFLGVGLIALCIPPFILYAMRDKFGGK